MSKRNRVHFDATPAGGIREALCGAIAFDTSVDLTVVDCKLCLKVLKRDVLTRESFAEELRVAVPQDARASAPPKLTPALWSCYAGTVPCGYCLLCDWFADVSKWHELSPWNEKSGVRRVDRSDSDPVWPSLNAALVALAEWERHDRCAPSATGFILSRLERGETGGQDTGAHRPLDPLLQRAGALVPVRRALENAYPDGGHETLASNECKAVLMARTPGVCGEFVKPEGESKKVWTPAMVDYDELAIALKTTAGELRAVVKHGRAAMTVELASRGLIPMPRVEHGLDERIEAARGKLVAYG